MEINLMANYPTTNRTKYIQRSLNKNYEEIKIVKNFDKEYFDGDREFGLGGYYYDPKFFKNVVDDFIKWYEISNDASILDIGCGKGFMLHDFLLAKPNIKIAGLDISKYCFEKSISTVKPFFNIGSCDNLPYKDKSFDYVFSIATIHNLDIEGVKKSLKEIVRVTKKNAFIKVNGYKNENEKNNLLGWNLVANTILHVDEWKSIFEETGYIYDYEFFST